MWQPCIVALVCMLYVCMPFCSHLSTISRRVSDPRLQDVVPDLALELSPDLRNAKVMFAMRKPPRNRRKRRATKDAGEKSAWSSKRRMLSSFQRVAHKGDAVSAACAWRTQ